MTKLTCQPTLRLQELSLSPDGGALRVIGPGFVVQGGQSQAHSWQKALSSPVVAAFLKNLGEAA